MILRHRDKEILRFEWLEPQGVHVVSVNAAETQFQPLEFRGAPTDENLWKWLVHRIVPSNRAHIQDLLLKLGYDPHDVKGIIRLCKGLSLNDVFWVVDDDFKGSWAHCNLYENSFSETISQMAFTGGGSFDHSNWSSSPELTTNGMLAKCWRRKNGVVTLYKSGTEGSVNAGFEPYSEFYAAQIAEAMDLPHASYGLARFKGRLCSTCPLFTSDRYGFIPAGRLMDAHAALSDSRFADIFFFDALIFNTDRHLGNFGFLIDNDTNEIVGAAPIFDNGYGLFSLAVSREGRGNEFDDLRKFVHRVHPALYANWLGFPGGVTAAMRDRLARLKGFRFKRHANFNLPTERLRIIEDFLQKRASQIEQYGVLADSFLKLSPADDTIKNKIPKGDTLNATIVANMKTDPFITIGELANMLSVPRPTLQRHIKALRLAGVIARQGARKTGCWAVDGEAFELAYGESR